MRERCVGSRPYSRNFGGALPSQLTLVNSRGSSGLANQFGEAAETRGENLPNGIPALTPSPSISREKIRKGRRTDGARLKSSLNVAEGRGTQTGRGAPGFPPSHSFLLRFPLNRCPDPDSKGERGVSAPPAQNTGSAKRETDLCILGNQSRGRPRGGKGGLGVDKGVSQS